MPKSTEYCHLPPEFPDKGYMAFVFVLHKNHVLGSIPLDAIYTDTDEAAKAIERIIKQLDDSHKLITIPQECILIPVVKTSLFPLRKEYWKKPEISYDEQTRITTFRPVLDNPSLFSLLVTPYSYDDTTKKWFLSAAMPLKSIDDSKPIEQFMMTSDYVVEPRANAAALYTFGEKIRFNWTTKELKPFKKHKSKNIND
jgi:hypothetical protein